MRAYRSFSVGDVYMKKLIAIFSAAFISVAAIAETPRVFFGNLKDGDKVTSPVHVEMKVQGMAVVPAGTMTENTGHFHIMIDSAPTPKGDVVPADEKHIHFGKGQTSVDLPLSSGPHTLTLQFADGAHRAYDMNSSVHITVE